MTDVIEYIRRSTLKKTNLNTAHKKGRSTVHAIVKNDFVTIVATEWKLSLIVRYLYKWGRFCKVEDRAAAISEGIFILRIGTV